MPLNYLLLILGFAFLIKGADFLVDGAASLAKRLGISAIAVGLTVVAFGTSAPELVVNIVAGIKGNTDLAIGNIVGSNIANIFLILGLAAVIYPLRVQKNTTFKEIPLALLAAIILAIMANDGLVDKSGYSALTRTDGLVLLGFFTIFLYYVFGISRNQGENQPDDIKIFSPPISILFVFLGLLGLTLGARWIVDSSVNIASSLGISEALIGLTVVAIGTSLPELATSVVAACKKHSDIAIGNIVGSNIFNVFWILGVSALIRPLPFSVALNLDLGVTLLATGLLFLFMFVGKKHVLQKHQGIMFLTFYVIYLAYLFARG